MQLQLESQNTEQIKKVFDLQTWSTVVRVERWGWFSKHGYLILGGFNNTENTSGSSLRVKAWGGHLVGSVPKQNLLQLWFFPDAVGESP